MSDATVRQAAENGIQIPAPPKTGAHHVAVVQTGNLLYHSGQTPIVDGVKRYLGRVGAELTTEEAQEAARIAAMNMISQIHAFLDGRLDRIRRFVRMTGYVNSAPDYYDQADVLHGASKAVLAVFGEERGLHARCALGMSPLPFNVSVVVDGIWELHEEK